MVKKVILLLAMSLIASSVYAATITITISDTQYDALTILTVTPEAWVQHAVENKANRMINRIVEDYSDKQAEKLTVIEKEEIVATVDLVTEKAKREGK